MKVFVLSYPMNCIDIRDWHCMNKCSHTLYLHSTKFQLFSTLKGSFSERLMFSTSVVQQNESSFVKFKLECCCYYAT